MTDPAAGAKCPYGSHQILRLAVLQQEPGRPAFERRRHLRIRAERRQHRHSRRFRLVHQPCQHGQAVGDRHADVEQDHVGGGA
jgi:hypothetical protein